MSFAAKELCRRMAAPREADLAALRRLARYLVGAPRQVYMFNLQDERPLDVFADTDWAGCSATRRSTSGGCAMRGGHLIKHWSCTQKVVTLSSGEAELAGVVKGASEGLGLQSIGMDLGLEMPLRVHTDSSAAQGICNRSGIGKVRHLAVSQLWVQERIRDKSFELYKVRGELNPADLFTKHLEQSQIRLFLAIMGLRAEAGRAESAPKLAAEVDAFLAGPGRAGGDLRAASGKTSEDQPLYLLSATPLCLCAFSKVCGPRRGVEDGTVDLRISSHNLRYIWTH